MNPATNINYGKLTKDLDSINRSLWMTAGHNSNALGRTWRAISGGPDKSVETLSELLQEKLPHFYHYVPTSRVPHLDPHSTLRDKLNTLSGHIIRVYPDTPERKQLLNQIQGILAASTAYTFSKEELLLNRIELGLPEEFPRLKRDQDGRVIDPAKQLRDLRELICEGLSSDHRRIQEAANLTTLLEAARYQYDNGDLTNLLFYPKVWGDCTLNADDYLYGAELAVDRCLLAFYNSGGGIVPQEEWRERASELREFKQFGTAHNPKLEALLPKEALKCEKLTYSFYPENGARINQLLQKAPWITELQIKIQPHNVASLFSGPPVLSIETLVLGSFREIPSTIGSLKKLKQLDISECPDLEDLPLELTNVPLETITCAVEHLPLLASYATHYSELKEINWKDHQGVAHHWKAEEGTKITDFLKQYRRINDKL